MHNSFIQNQFDENFRKGLKKTVRFKRFEKLNDELISLGIDPPEQKINPDYKEQPSNIRKCFQCGKMHDTIVENTWTGERLEEIDKCIDCLIAPMFSTIR